MNLLFRTPSQLVRANSDILYSVPGTQKLQKLWVRVSGQAPAAGWIKKIIAEPGVGIFGEVVWTSTGRAGIVNREYRYLSPVASVRKDDGRVVALHSAALTNKPALVGASPLINREDATACRSPLSDDQDPLDSPDLGPEEGAAVDAGDDRESAAALSVLRAELQLSPECEVEQVLVEAGRKIAALRQNAVERQASERVDKALRAGKLVAAQRVWAEHLARKDEALFDEWMRTAPAVVPLRRSWDGGAPWSAPREPSSAASARAEYSANPALQSLTTEDAFVRLSIREERIAAA